MGNRVSLESIEETDYEKDLQIRMLENRILELEDELSARPKDWDDAIDEYIDNWFENHKDAIDIGAVKIMGRVKVDLMPDELEKHIYKKTLKILFSLMARPGRIQ